MDSFIIIRKFWINIHFLGQGKNPKFFFLVFLYIRITDDGLCYQWLMNPIQGLQIGEKLLWKYEETWNFGFLLWSHDYFVLIA